MSATATTARAAPEKESARGRALSANNSAASFTEPERRVKLARGSLNGTPQPHSIEAEQSVLGSMLVSPRDTIVAECITKINDADFYIPAHRTVYNVLVELWNAGQANRPDHLHTSLA